MNLGLWEKLKGKIVTHRHAQEVVNHVCMARVDAGIYYATCPFDSAPGKVMSPNHKIVAELPEGSYPSVKAQAGMLRTSKKKRESQLFLRLLLEPKMQKLLAQLGIPNFQTKIFKYPKNLKSKLSHWGAFPSCFALGWALR